MHSRRALAIQRAQMAFARGARTGVGDDPQAGRDEDRVEGVGVLGVPVSDQELQAVGPLTKVHERVPGLLYRPGGGRVGGDACQADAAMAVLYDEHHVETAEKDRVDVEEVDRGNCLGLRGQELPPAGACASRRWVNSGFLEDLPDSGGRELVPEPCQFAADSPVAPGRIVTGHLQREPADRRASARPSGRPMTVGPVAPDPLCVPAQEHTGCGDQGQLAAMCSGEPPGEGGQSRRVGP